MKREKEKSLDCSFSRGRSNAGLSCGSISGVIESGTLARVHSEYASTLNATVSRGSKPMKMRIKRPSRLALPDAAAHRPAPAEEWLASRGGAIEGSRRWRLDGEAV
jgi:hypothetical protein